MAEPFEHIQRLAELFLSKAGRRTASPPASRADGGHLPTAITAGETPVEIILVGHLPVRAGLWLTQYADDVAREKGATALVRIEENQQILEILRGRESAARASGSRTIAEGITAVGREVRRWIVRPDPTAPLDMLIEARPDLITILSGADEAAVVAAYRLIKDIAEAAGRVDLSPPPIVVAVLGADPLEAERAAEKIDRTARDHLGLTVKLGRCVRSMGSLGSTLHFRFASERPVPLVALVAALRHGDAEDLMHIDVERETTVAEAEYEADGIEPAETFSEPEEEAFTVSAGDEALQSIVTPIPPSGFDVPTPDHSPPPLSQPGQIEAPPRSPAKLRPKPSVQIEAKTVAPSPPPRDVPAGRRLASWIDGLATLPIQCTEAPDVEIAVDTAGNLHLIGWEDQLRAVAQVRGWVRRNCGLIAMACPDHAIRTEAEVIVHLVTSEPANVADLLQTELRLHVLAPVEVEGKTGWYAAALNAT